MQETWILAGNVLLLSVYGFVSMRTLYHKAQRWRQSSLSFSISRWCHALRARIARACAPRQTGEDTEEEDKIEQFVAARVAGQANEDYKRLLGYVVFLLATGLVANIWNIIRGAVRWNTQGDDTLSIVGFAILLLVHTFPKLINRRLILIWYSMLMGFLILKLWPSETSTKLFYRSVVNWVLRHIFSVSLRKPWAVGCWQVVYVASSSYRFIELFEAEREITVSQHFLMEFFVMATTIGFSITANKASHDKVRQEIRSTALRDQRSSLVTMLELMCDVVVELGSSLDIKGGAEKFAALMTMGGSSKSAQGRQLQEFVPLKEDREQLEKCLLSSAEASDKDGGPLAAGVLHLKLRDAMGNHLSFELFYVQVQHLNEQGFFVGICEQTDSKIADLRPFEKTAPAKKGRGGNDPVAGGSGLRGTPPVAIGRALAPEVPEVKEDKEREDSGSASRGSSSNGSAISVLEPTNHKGMALSLCQTLATWASEGVEGSCCPFHHKIAAAKASLDIMAKYSCAPNFGSSQGTQSQCQHCGILVQSKHRMRAKTAAIIRMHQPCTLCGHKPARHLESKTKKTADKVKPSGRSFVEL